MVPKSSVLLLTYKYINLTYNPISSRRSQIIYSKKLIAHQPIIKIIQNQIKPSWLFCKIKHNIKEIIHLKYLNLINKITQNKQVSRNAICFLIVKISLITKIINLMLQKFYLYKKQTQLIKNLIKIPQTHF